MADLLQVEYEYGEIVPLMENIPEIVLPEFLLSRLKEAAELGHVAELEESLEEVRKLGDEGRLLAERLLKLSRNFDMGGILDILGAMEHE